MKRMEAKAMLGSVISGILKDKIMDEKFMSFSKIIIKINTASFIKF